MLDNKGGKGTNGLDALVAEFNENGLGDDVDEVAWEARVDRRSSAASSRHAPGSL
jgi:hypothetical protein